MSYTIERILDSLIGDVSWHGETNADNNSLRNLETLEDAVYHLDKKLDSLVAAIRSHPGNRSAEQLGSRASRILNGIGVIDD